MKKDELKKEARKRMKVLGIGKDDIKKFMETDKPYHAFPLFITEEDELFKFN